MITIERETLQAALDALDYLGDSSDKDVTRYVWFNAKAEQACTALRTALAQPPMVDDMQDIPLPETFLEKVLDTPDWQGVGGLDASSMYGQLAIAVARAYGDAREAAATERAAKLCEEVNDTTGECPELALYCADAIRGS